MGRWLMCLDYLAGRKALNKEAGLGDEGVDDEQLDVKPMMKKRGAEGMYKPWPVRGIQT